MSKANRKAPQQRSAWVQCWKFLSTAAERSPEPAMRKFAGAFRDRLAEARVISVPPSQVAALPPAAETWTQEARLLATARAPFAATFLDLGGEFAWGDGRKWSETPFYAALILEAQDGLLVVPFVRAAGRVLTTGHLIADRSGSLFEGLPTRIVGDPNQAIETARVIPWMDEQTLDQVDSSTGKLARLDVIEQGAAGAMQAMRVVYMLESVNVDVTESAGPAKGHRAHGIPHYTVDVRQNSKRSVSNRPSQKQDWSHRWEVRGHFKHFRKGATYDANPERRVLTPDGTDCVRVWCPPFVKGPEDKPLIPKRRDVRP